MADDFGGFGGDRSATSRMEAGFSLSPGSFVTNPAQPDWGLGQVQSVVGSRVTVNFEDAGKLTIDVSVVPLVASPA